MITVACVSNFSSDVLRSVCVALFLSLYEGDRLICEAQQWNSRTHDCRKKPERAPDLHQPSERVGTHICRASESGEEPLLGLFIRQYRSCYMRPVTGFPLKTREHEVKLKGSCIINSLNLYLPLNDNIIYNCFAITS